AVGQVIVVGLGGALAVRSGQQHVQSDAQNFVVIGGHCRDLRLNLQLLYKCIITDTVSGGRSEVITGANRGFTWPPCRIVARNDAVKASDRGVQHRGQVFGGKEASAAAARRGWSRVAWLLMGQNTPDPFLGLPFTPDPFSSFALPGKSA